MPRLLGRYTHQRSSYSQLCCSMPHSKIAGVEKHPCGSDTRHVGPSGRVAALIFEAQAAPLELGDGMLWEPCPISPLPCPCLILARVRLPFRLATMASSACIASSQAAPRDAPPQHPMQPNLPQNPRTRMHQPLQIFISPLIARWTDRR